MGFFNPTPEELAKKQEKQFAASPAGQARAARAAGLRIFQIDVPLSHTRGVVLPMVGAFANSGATQDYAETIQAIEDEGWRLEHVGYVYRILGTESRDKFMASGQQGAFHGEIVGIYIFRSSGAA